MEPWLLELSEGRTQAAWDLFAERYRRLMLATIKRLVPDHDAVMDVFSTVCQALTANDFARLRRYSGQNPQCASVATWLVAVVRNLTIDWLRQHEGRRRPTVPAHLSSLQQEIYRAVCLDGSSHVEAYEIIQSRSAPGLTPDSPLGAERTRRATRRGASLGSPGLARSGRMARSAC